MVVLLALVACTKQDAERSKPAVVGQPGSAAIAPPPPPSNSAIRVPANPPPVARITFTCSHSNMPWGNGSQYQSTVYDLDAATVTHDSTDTPNRKDDAPRPPPQLPGSGAGSGAGSADDGVTQHHSTAKLDPEKVTKLRAAVAAVLAGGPYEPEYPPSEGISCDLALAATTGAPFFVIDKAQRDRKDAVNSLLNAL